MAVGKILFSSLRLVGLRALSTWLLARCLFQFLDMKIFLWYGSNVAAGLLGSGTSADKREPVMQKTFVLLEQISKQTFRHSLIF